MPKLVLIGGNEFLADDHIDTAIAKISIGSIGVIPFAQDDWQRTTQLVESKYPNRSIQLLTQTDKLLPDDIGIVYLKGGHPDKLYKALSDSVLWKDIKKKWQANKLVIAGSSAGSMIVFDKMMTHNSRMKGGTGLTPGLGLINSALVVPHWNTTNQDWRQRFISEHRDLTIIAIDENTAVFCESGQAKVVGLGNVAIRGQETTNYSSGESFKLELALN